MKKMIAFMFVMAFIIGGSVNFAKAALISLVWDGVDSADQNEVVIPGYGTYDVSLMVSDINLGDPEIFEMQFDLVAPETCTFQIPNELLYGGAVANWMVKMGGVLKNNTYREFSAEWAGGKYPLNNGMLVSGITLTIPDQGYPPGASFDLDFGNAQGDYAEYLDFANMKLTCIPIPGGLILLGSGLIGLIGLGRRRIKKS